MLYYKYYIQMTNFRMYMFSLECFSALYHQLTAFLAGETNVPESI